AVDGMTSAAFEERERHLAGALAACAEIDVRPTPLLQTLDETLWLGWNTRVQFRVREGFTDRPSRDAPVMERLQQQRRRDLEKQRGTLASRYYPRVSPRSVQMEVPSFTDRIEMIRAYMANRARIFAVIDLLTDPESRTENGDTLYTKKAAEKIGAAFASLPAAPHAFDPAAPPHLDLFLALAESIPSVIAFLRDRTPAAQLDERLLRHYAELVAAGFGPMDWDYLVDAPASRNRIAALAFLLESGGAAATDERYAQWIKLCTQGRNESLCIRAHPSAELLVRNRERVPASWLNQLDRLLPLWERHHAGANERSRRWFLSTALRLLEEKPPGDNWKSHCERFETRWMTIERLAEKPLGPKAAVCACIRRTGEERKLSRVGALKLLYRRAVNRGLSCVQRRRPKG
ncbi:MAG: hypothetical protein AAF658_14315, partial [Myxococcota bacterium]